MGAISVVSVTYQYPEPSVRCIALCYHRNMVLFSESVKYDGLGVYKVTFPRGGKIMYHRNCPLWSGWIGNTRIFQCPLSTGTLA